MLRFVVTKNGKVVGKPFASREEAEQLSELERVADPSADVWVEPYPVLTVGKGLDPAEGQALVEAILDGADFSDLPPEHRGPMGSSDEEQGEAAPDASPGHGGSGKGKKPTEQGKKKGEAPPPKSFSFFVRHSSYVPVADEVLEELWAQDRFAVPLPGEGGAGGYPEGPTAVIPQKPWVHEMTAKYVADLAKWGGYAWAETRVRPGVAKVGRVVPQRPGDIRVASTAPKHSQHASGESSSEVVLKTLQLEDVKEVTLDKATTLRAERPLTGTIRPWPAAGSRLEAMVEGVPLDRTWANLTPL